MAAELWARTGRGPGRRKSPMTARGLKMRRMGPRILTAGFGPRFPGWLPGRFAGKFPSISRTLRSMKYPVVTNFVGGHAAAPAALLQDVFDPSVGQVISKVSLSTAAEVDHAAQTAKLAAGKWSATPIKERAQVFFRYKALLEAHVDELAAL